MFRIILSHENSINSMKWYGNPERLSRCQFMKRYELFLNDEILCV